MDGNSEALYGIVLAAGYSSRAGAFKMALPLQDRPVLHHVLDAMCRSVAGIIVVSGHEAEQVGQLVARYKAPCRMGEGGIRVVHNPLYDKGMFTSVVAGARAVPPGHGVFITPGDCPLIPASIYAAMSEFKGPVLIPRVGQKKGHPVLLDQDAVSALASVAGDGREGTLRDFLDKFVIQIRAVDAPGILLDLDTPEDYIALQEYAGLRKT